MGSLATLPERHPALGHALVLAATVLAAVVLFDLGRADLSVPFAYTGDALFYGMTTQTVLEQGWYGANDRLGMPFGTVLLDFPVPDSLSLGLLRVLGTMTGDWATAMNAFYLLGYPLVAWTSLLVLRRLGLAYWPAFLAALLYAYSSYHVVRGEYHLLYTSYYTVPLLVLVLLWLCAGEVGMRRAADVLQPRFLASVAICAAVASTGGAYFAFFGCALLLAVAAYRVVDTRRARAALLPLFLLAVTFAFLVFNLWPSIVYRAEHGSVGTAQRPFHDAEFLGLKLVQMLLPVSGHRIDALAAARALYDSAPVHNREAAVSLGVLGSLGLLGLALRLLVVRRRPGGDPRTARLDHLAVLAGAALAVGTVGGLGAVFAFFVSSQIRGYDRIVVFVGFFAVAAVALVADRVGRRWFRSPGRQPLFAAVILLLTTVGILDQVPREPLPRAATDAHTFAQDREFFGRVEATLPADAMLFQLPHHGFPEGGTYDDLRPYLHTRGLRFSAGAISGREAARWQEHVAAQPAPVMAGTLAAAGFAAILVDVWHVGPAAARLQAELQELLGPPLLRDAEGRYSLFDLGALAPAPAAEVQGRRREAALRPVFVEWGEGFSAREGEWGEGWRWGQAAAELVLENDLDRTRAIELDMTITAAGSGVLAIEGDLLAESLAVRPVPVRVVRRLRVPPGRHALRLHCDAPPLVLPHDGRSVVYRVSEFATREEV